MVFIDLHLFIACFALSFSHYSPVIIILSSFFFFTNAGQKNEIFVWLNSSGISYGTALEQCCDKRSKPLKYFPFTVFLPINPTEPKKEPENLKIK